MTHDEIWRSLVHLGFDGGWVLSGEEITVWEWDEPKPSQQVLEQAWKEIQAAEQAAIAAKESAKAKLAALGLTEAEVNALIGGN